jgi:hypothetical protein
VSIGRHSEVEGGPQPEAFGQGLDRDISPADPPDHAARVVPDRIHWLASEEGVEPERFAARGRGLVKERELDRAARESLDLVHVKALLEPAAQQRRGRGAVRADLPHLCLVHRGGIHRGREEIERDAGEGFRQGATLCGELQRQAVPRSP